MTCKLVHCGDCGAVADPIVGVACDECGRSGHKVTHEVALRDSWPSALPRGCDQATTENNDAQ